MAHQQSIKVRFSETDALGHISNISYFIYLEEARVEFFRELGFKMDIANWNVILISASCDFIKQGYFDQKLTVISHIDRIGNSSFKIEHEIVDTETGSLIAKGSAGGVYFNFDTQKSELLPADIRRKLEKHQREV